MSRVYPALFAVLLGLVLALALAVPYVAVQYRRRGTVRGGPTLLALAVLIYALAVLSYTLLPLPTPGPGFCANGGAGVQLRLGQLVTDITAGGLGGPSTLLRNGALRGVVFNVVLFVPLGMFLRHLTHRGVALTTLSGLGVSLLVETTQLTGDWFAYPCAYRVFDVDDLLANTVGALLGALMARVLRLVPGQEPRDPGLPRPVTARRRLLGMAVDWLLSVAAGLALGFAYTAVVLATGATVPPRVDRTVQTLLVNVVPALVLLVGLWSTHRTVGEAVVRLRPREPVGALAALLRWLFGIGGYLLLSAGSDEALGATVGGALDRTFYGAPALATLLAVVSVVAVLGTRGNRGLAYRMVGWEVVDDRADVLAKTASD